MFERFTDRARRVLVLAQEEARFLNHSFIGTEHLLLGLVREEDGIAAQALEALGISLETARQRVEEATGIGGSAPSGSPPFTPRAKKVLELSLRESLQLGHSYIGTEHMLLGLVREGEGTAVQVLAGLGADLSQVRQQVIQRLSGYRGTEGTELPGLPGTRPTGFGKSGMSAGVLNRRRCALCGRSLSETAHFVEGARGRACEECIRTGAELLDGAPPERRGLILPPRVSGEPPDAPPPDAPPPGS